MLTSFSLKAVQGLIFFVLLACPALCQMVYNVSVYSDASTDGSTLFATSTRVDNSTGCSAHGSYSTTVTLIAPDGTQAPSTSTGMIANTSMAINGRTTGNFTVTGIMQFYCGCFMHWVGGGGPNLTLSFAITYTQSTSLYSDANGWCPQKNACTNTGSPKCKVVSTRVDTHLVPCGVYYESLMLLINGRCSGGIEWPAGGPGVCTI